VWLVATPSYAVRRLRLCAIPPSSSLRESCVDPACPSHADRITITRGRPSSYSPCESRLHVRTRTRPVARPPSRRRDAQITWPCGRPRLRLRARADSHGRADAPDIRVDPPSSRVRGLCGLLHTAVWTPSGCGRADHARSSRGWTSHVSVELPSTLR